MTPEKLAKLSSYLSDKERAELESLLAQDFKESIWVPLPGPQTLAYQSTADVIGYGGSAGGGKTDLAIGKALTQHQVVQIFRREGTELGGIIDRMQEIVGNDNGLGGKPPVWRGPTKRTRIVEFGSCPTLGDERKYQGRAKDFLVIDEAANFLEAQVRFLMGWVRTTDPKQKCQTLLCFNPPTSIEGRWVVDFFAPWLDVKFPKPAQPGELRYVAVIEGKDVWVPDERRFILSGTERVYDFDPGKHNARDVVTPQSRTFIPARVTDNPYLVGTNYMSTLQAMPEPLRSQMLYGDFRAGMEDSEYQVIPTAWVEAAMGRWKDVLPRPEMDSIGYDVARGGKDNSILIKRHGMWFDKPVVKTGKETPDGPTAAGVALGHLRDNAVIHVDVIGVGASVFDSLVTLGQDVVGVNVAEGSTGKDKSGRLSFFNLRSELVWRMREALDPVNNTGIALPDDAQLKADLCAYSWKPRGAAIYVLSRDEIIDKIGRSPDWGSACILALIDTPKRKTLHALLGRGGKSRDYDPLENVERIVKRDYDPLEFR